MKQHKATFSEAIQKTIQLLDGERIDYFLLGGVATAFVGEPRLTRDIDVDIFLTKTRAISLLNRVERNLFKVNEKQMRERIKTFGNFRMFYKGIPIDMILASTELEESALKRRKSVTLYGKKTFVPSPEDFILLKIIPGRPQDIVDVQSVVLKYGKRLDIRYLEKWAQRIADEMENYRILHQLHAVLNSPSW